MSNYYVCDICGHYDGDLEYYGEELLCIFCHNEMMFSEEENDL